MNSEQQKEIRLKLLINSPIMFYNKKIKVPQISDIVSLGNEKYNKTLLMFLLSDEALFQGSKGGVERFDTIVLLEQYRTILIEALSFFFEVPTSKILPKVDKIESTHGVSYSTTIFVDELMINRFRFEELRELIMLLTRTEEIKTLEQKEDSYDFKDSLQEERYKKFLQAKNKHLKKEQEEKKGSDLYYMITYLVLNSKKSFEEVSKLNMEQFNALFKATTANEQNDFELTKLSTGVIGSDGLDIKSLFERIKNLG